ncbi:DNA topoisomerase 1 [Diplonema papillatum]|nr:DNA topoisomerase 1 [Diplonema papillatum]
MKRKQIEDSDEEMKNDGAEEEEVGSSGSDNDDDEASDDEPVTKKRKPAAKKSAQKPAKKKASPKKAAAAEESDESSEEEEADDEEEDSDDEPVVRKSASKKAGAKPAAKKAPAKKDAKEKKPKDDDEPAFEWWKYEDKDLFHDGIVKWKTLEHAGPMFAGPYVPHGIPIKYEGVEFTMTPEEEEIATFFAIMRESHYYKKEQFRNNFFSCWTEVLRKRPAGKKIQKLALCNFDLIWEKHLQEREIKKSLPIDVKKKQREELAKELEKYRWVLWDGRKEKVANPRVEPPGLFQGRGQHPRMGMVKKRIMPEDITINCQDKANPPPPPAGHKWGEVITDNTVSWLCKWWDTNTGDTKYVMLDRSGVLKQWGDREKFEKARRLKDKIAEVRADYTAGFKSKDERRLQMSVAMYFIDILALRVGGEKGEDEADTVGCCSLRYEHVKPFTRGEGVDKKFFLHFNFLGKDSIRYVNDMEVAEEVHALVGRLLKGKDARAVKENQLFDLVTPTDLNKHFKRFMDGLSAKVFRTYNASYLLDKIFWNEPVDSSITEAEKLVYFNEANTKVAVLCNHQKSVAKGHEAVKEGMEKRIDELNGAIERLQKAKEAISKAKKSEFDKVWEREKDAYNKIEQKIQWDWLNAYGTDEEKEKYKASLETGRKSSSSRKVKPAKDSDDDEIVRPRKRKAKADDSDSEPVVAKKRKPGAKASSKRVLDSDDDDDDDDENEDSDDSDAKPVVKKSGRKPAAKKAGAKRGKKAAESGSAEDSDDDDDDKPVKRGGRKPAAKKGKPASESEEEGDAESEQGSSSGEEEEDEANTVRKPARKKAGGKKAVAKKAARKAGGKKAAASDDEDSSE